MPSILFLTTSLGHRTFRKTVRMMEHAGARVRMVGFSRGLYPPSKETFPVQDFGSLTHGRYLARIVSLAKRVGSIRAIAREYDVLHCFGLDSLLIGRVCTAFRTTTIVYQVQDIRPVLYGSSLASRLARLLESVLLRRVSHIVVSSPAYYTDHFTARYRNCPKSFTVLENKLEHDPRAGMPAATVTSVPERDHSGPIRVGYFGVLRCPQSFNILERSATEAGGRMTVLIRGVPQRIADFEARVASSPSMVFDGPYRDPDDLPELYGQVDLVWAAYPWGGGRPGNWQWARTVRFYEAGAWGLPVVVQAGTQDALLVARHDLGLVLDMAEPDDCVSALLSVTPEDLSRWAANMRSLPREMFVHGNEYREYLKRLEATEAHHNRSVFRKGNR